MGVRDIIRQWTGRAPRRPVLPTADYYFLSGIADLVGEHPVAARPILRRGPNTWTSGDRLVVVRYATTDELAWVETGRWRSVHYIVDDLLPAAETSRELPADYRERLGRFAREMMPRILALSPVVVAPSTAILDAFPGLEHRLLGPACLSLCDGGRLAAPCVWDGPPRVAFLGTRSHAGSLLLIDAVAGLLERSCPAARLHLFLGAHLPPEIARRRVIVNRGAMPWQAFRDFSRTARFHAAIAPVQDTPFARARSITKLMDHAAVGAVGLYGDRPPFRDVVTHGVDGLLLSDDPQAWADAILGLADDPSRAIALAERGRALAARLGDPARIRQFWLRELGLDVRAG